MVFCGGEQGTRLYNADDAEFYDADDTRVCVTRVFSAGTRLPSSNCRCDTGEAAGADGHQRVRGVYDSAAAGSRRRYGHGHGHGYGGRDEPGDWQRACSKEGGETGAGSVGESVVMRAGGTGLLVCLSGSLFFAFYVVVKKSRIGARAGGNEIDIGYWGSE